MGNVWGIVLILSLGIMQVGCTLDAALMLNSPSLTTSPGSSTIGGLNAFARNGVYQKNLQFSLGDTPENIRDIVTLGNGQILIAGTLENPNTYRDFYVARLNSDGSIDDTFGVDGFRSFDLGQANYDDLYRLSLDSTGRIIVAGNMNLGNSLWVARLTPEGDLDASFGSNGGIVNIPITGTTVVGARALLITSTQEIIVGGFGYFGGAGSGRYDFVTARLLPDGSLDTTWGGTGIVKTDLATDTYDYVYDLAEDQNSSIVAVGASYVASLTSHDMGIVRYTATGALDTTFNGSGKLRFDFGISDGEYANSVTHDSQGRILIGGSSKTSAEGDFAIVRLLASGSPDSTFDSDGIFEISSGSSQIDSIVGLTSLSDDSIVAYGSKSTSGDSDFCALRVLETGVPDSTFSADGVHCENIRGNDDYASNGSVDSDGSIYIVGRVKDTSSYDDLAILKLSNLGSPVSTFATTGKFSLNIGSTSEETFVDMKLDSSDRVIALADSYASGVTQTALTRVDADGAKDTSFGTNGVFLFSLHPTDPIYASALGQTPDGKWVVVGGDSNKFIIARVLADGGLDTSFNTTGKVEWTPPANHYVQISDIIVDDQNRTIVVGSLEDTDSNNTFIARFLPNGSIDTSFATNGYAMEDINALSTDEFTEVTMNSQGKIIAVGTSANSSTNNNDIIVTQYNDDGSKAAGFGSNGTSIIQLETNADDYGYAIAVDSSDSIFVAGKISSDQEKTYLLKLNSAGNLDNSFGSGTGFITVTYSSRSSSLAVEICISSNNNILLFGENSSEWTLTSVKPNGDLDTSFKDTGNTSFEVITSRSHDAKTLIESGDGGFYLGGQISGDSRILITKVRSNGTLLSQSY